MALTSSLELTAFDDLLEVVSPHHDLIHQLHELVTAEASEAYAEAAQRIAAHIEKVVKNNPTKTFDEIMARPDVQSALGELLARAADRAEGAVREGWSAADDLGRDHAETEMEAIGLEAPDTQPADDSLYLADVISDLRDNADSAFGSAFAALELGFAEAVNVEGAENVRKAAATARAARMHEFLLNALNKVANRIRAGASVAVTRGYTTGQTDVYAATMESNPGVLIRKVWLANFKDGHVPCPVCTALHGSIIELHEEFDGNATFAGGLAELPVWGDLSGPPRHPNCQCRVALYVDAFDDEGVADQLKAQGLEVATNNPGMTPMELSRRSRFVDAHGNTRVVVRRNDGTFGVGFVLGVGKGKGRSGRRASGQSLRGLVGDRGPDVPREAMDPDLPEHHVSSSQIRGLSKDHYDMAVDAFAVCVHGGR